MAKNNNLTDFLTDVANAIREKDGTTGTINPQDFSDKIKAIQTGVDTSDGNIEPTTVLKGYKGYAKGVAVNGAIETYDGTVEDVGVNKGDLITIEGNQYRVLKVNDNVAEVLAMYNASTSQVFNATSKTVTFSGGGNYQRYNGSDLDNYLTTTYYDTLSQNVKNAIVAKSIEQDAYQFGSSAPSSGNYYHLAQGAFSQYIYNLNYGVATIGSRKIYALSVSDVIDYLELSSGDTFSGYDLRQLFWNSTAGSTDVIWLRTAFGGADIRVIVVDGNWYIQNEKNTATKCVRPAFQIDLSKIAYTKN